MEGLGARSKSGDGLQWIQADDGVLWDVLLGPMLRRMVAVEVQNPARAAWSGCRMETNVEW